MSKQIEAVYWNDTTSDKPISLHIHFPINKVSVVVYLINDDEENVREYLTALNKMHESIGKLLHHISSNTAVEIDDVADIRYISYVPRTEWTSGSTTISLETTSGCAMVNITIPNTPELFEQINQVHACIAQARDSFQN